MTLQRIHVKNRTIGGNSPPLIVAELSANHRNSLSLALELVDAAFEAGCDAIKLQTYSADTMTLFSKKEKFINNDPKSPWEGRTLHEVYSEGALPLEWHEKLFERAKKHDLLYFSSPFAPEFVDFLEPLKPDFYKIASLEIVDFPLIRKCAATKRPLIISTGASTFTEISEALDVAKRAGASEIILLKCTSSYPTPIESVNLRTMVHMKEAFKVLTGLSDHTLGIGAPLAATALGASMIEKHFTISRKAGGLDASFSLEPAEMKLLVHEVHNAHKALGDVLYGVQKGEETEFSHRRSLYFVKNLKKGEIITIDALRALRPAGGLHTQYLEMIIGKRVTLDIEAGTEVSWNHLLYE